MAKNLPLIGKKAKSTIPLRKKWQDFQIKHLYTRPYRPQTNGKVEAFWKIIKREFLTKYFFKDWREFNLKLYQYLSYYNNKRKHGGVQYLTPVQKLVKLQLEDSLEKMPKVELMRFKDYLMVK